MELVDLGEAAERLGFRVRRGVQWLSPPTWLAVAASRRRRRGAPPRPPVGPAQPIEIAHDADDGDVWFDFVADTGDGFDATATVAHSLAAPHLAFADGIRTHRGRLLVHGGDMAYPAGTDRVYRDRFIGPYAAMLPEAEPPPTIVGIPGNHDYYDGLQAWARVMTEGGSVGAWRTAQSRSWFVAHLARSWWAVGVDMQEGGTVDRAQRSELEALVGAIPAGSDVIVFVPEPAWFRSRSSTAVDTHRWIRDDLVGRVGRSTVRMFVAGDFHHYSRYRTVDAATELQLVTAGGGGAFLSSTHQLPRSADYLGGTIEADETSIYPTRETSRGLRSMALALPFRNRGFPAIAAGVYAVLGATTARRPGGDARSLVESLTNPLAVVAVIAVFAGALVFTQRRSWTSVPVALLHTAMHVVAVAAVATVVDGSRFPTAVTAAATGALVGGFVVGVALVASNLVGLNDNELFSAIRIDRFRNFLRFRVATDGSLTMFPIGIDEPSRRWRPNHGAVEAGWTPRMTAVDRPSPALIEPPVVLRPGGG